MAYNIPFSKQNVDKYLLDPHPFGPDSENITDINQVVYYGKFQHEDNAMMSHRDNTYSYDQLILRSWQISANLTNTTWWTKRAKLQLRAINK